METSERVKENLKRLDIDATTLKKNLIEYLVQIEMVLERKRTLRSDLLGKLADADYTVKSIAIETGISRTTFYSYDGLLQKYIEMSHEEDYREDPYVQIKSLKATIRRLQEENSLMSKRDCQELLLKAENKRLKAQLAEKDQRIEALRAAVFNAKS